MNHKRKFIATLGLALLSSLACAQSAGSYPTKPIKIVVPFPGNVTID